MATTRITTRLTVLGLGFVLSAPGLAMMFQQHQPEAFIWKEFVSFEKQDLLRLDESQRERLYQLVGLILPRVNEGPGQSFSVFCLGWFQSRENGSRFIVVECRPLTIIPGLSKARIHIFDTQGKLLSSVEFQTGWRITITGAKILQDNPLGVPLIEIESENVINGRDVARQLYGLIGDDVALLRLENSKGEILRNDYSASNLTIGPPLSHRLLEDWENSLRPDNLLEILSTLVWLGGKPWDFKDRRTLPSGDPRPPEVEQQAISVDQARARKAIEAKLSELVRSQNPWIKEAAEFALKPEN